MVIEIMMGIHLFTSLSLGLLGLLVRVAQSLVQHTVILYQNKMLVTLPCGYPILGDTDQL